MRKKAGIIRGLVLSGLLSSLLLVSGCVTNVVVAGSVPTPLVKALPLKMGVYYSEDFKNFKHSEPMPSEGMWHIFLGEQNLTFFKSLIGAMFEQVVELDTPELSEAQKPELDGIIIPKIEKYGFLTPGISGLKFYSASIHYRILILDKNKRQIKDWTVLGYGKSEGGAFKTGDVLGEATMLAIRDAGARISIGLPEQPEIINWVQALDKARHEN